MVNHEDYGSYKYKIVKLWERRGRAPAGVAGLISPLPLSLSFIILPIYKIRATEVYSVALF